MRIMKKWVCPVCGYVLEADSVPDGFVCPTCKCPGTKFTEMKTGGALAAEHVFGVGTQLDACTPADKAWIIEQLKANFNGECSEVGMYLCMARIATREGYPEIALYWEKAAYEEAEHAAKFAELLGSECEANMSTSTKKNLAWRVDCEYGACAGKFELAKKAKEYGLDAIHDTVHEMARDEARHGRGFEGLYKRYFAVDLAKEKAAEMANQAKDKAADIAGQAMEKAGELAGEAKAKLEGFFKK